MRLFHLLLFTSVFLIFVGCVPIISKVVEHDRLLTANGFDFRSYTEKGFLFTPLDPQGNYESKGIVRISLLPSVKKAPSSYVTSKLTEFHAVEWNEEKFWIERLNAKIAIDSAYNVAVRLGANALTQFSIKREQNEAINKMFVDAAPYVIYGFAVKIPNQNLE